MPEAAVEPEPVKTAPMLLSYQGKPFAELMNVPPGMPKEILGEPVFYAVKDVMSVGEFTNHGRGFHMSVTKSRIQQWCETGNKMIAAGLRIPVLGGGTVPDDHDAVSSNQKGWVVKFSVAGPVLKATCQLIGDDARLLAARNDTSVGVDPNYTDSTGKNWGDAIVHIAMTPVPVRVGADFQAASSNSEVLCMSGATVMPKTMCFSDEDWNTMQQGIPGLAQMSDDMAPRHIADHVKKMCDYGKMSDIASMSREALVVKLSGVTAELTATKTQIQAMSEKTDAPKMHKSTIRNIASTVRGKIKNLSTGTAPRITSACGEKLAEVLLGTDATPNLQAMSSASEDADPIAYAVLDALESNVMTAGEMTGVQAMSRVEPGAEKVETKTEDEPEYKRMARLIERKAAVL